eukprot:CAMPEP_0185772716 /NCGR_PEP_ID=MMETSP1174-20130828/70420_1 /TAXON_ID=35687 /ORGANISM="Dictyocha speculum, Strain CCMP1381" /LENGTH=154 /DNA_ID=CAMNT_0028459121 /DNA_START=526 /DNA_END=989 /DNA_ORIENTATION=-
MATMGSDLMDMSPESTTSPWIDASNFAAKCTAQVAANRTPPDYTFRRVSLKPCVAKDCIAACEAVFGVLAELSQARVSGPPAVASVVDGNKRRLSEGVLIPRNIRAQFCIAVEVKDNHRYVFWRDAIRQNQAICDLLFPPRHVEGTISNPASRI